MDGEREGGGGMGGILMGCEGEGAGGRGGGDAEDAEKGRGEEVCLHVDFSRRRRDSLTRLGLHCCPDILMS